MRRYSPLDDPLEMYNETLEEWKARQSHPALEVTLREFEVILAGRWKVKTLRNGRRLPAATGSRGRQKLYRYSDLVERSGWDLPSADDARKLLKSDPTVHLG